MRTTTIDGHTFAPEYLRNGWVIDAGCRGWRFAYGVNNYFIEGLDHNSVYALDIEDFDSTEIKSIAKRPVKFKHAALMSKPGEIEAYYFGNGTGNFVKGINDPPYNGPDRPCETKKVQAITLQDIYGDIGTDIDLLKMDIEGSEYEIMMGMEPIPKQISVEFHEHTNKKLHNQYIEEILHRLHKWYHINLYIREWPQYKFMDCLFIRKDLL